MLGWAGGSELSETTTGLYFSVTWPGLAGHYLSGGWEERGTVGHTALSDNNFYQLGIMH